MKIYYVMDGKYVLNYLLLNSIIFALHASQYLAEKLLGIFHLMASDVNYDQLFNDMYDHP